MIDPKPDAPSAQGAPEQPSAAPLKLAVLDQHALANLRKLDPSGAQHLVERVLGVYSASLARLCDQLVAARQRPDGAAVHLAVHTLKSSSLNVGALVLAELCTAAETAIREGRVDGLSALLDRLQAEAGRVDAAVRQYLSGSG